MLVRKDPASVTEASMTQINATLVDKFLDGRIVDVHTLTHLLNVFHGLAGASRSKVSEWGRGGRLVSRGG